MSTEGEAARLHERYKRGEVSPVDVAREQLAAIVRLNPRVNAFVLVEDVVALNMAQASEARYRRGEALGPLDGVPITIKDTLNVAGWPTRRGSRTTSDAPARRDAISVARLRAAGAVFLGKTTTPEFAWKGLTESLTNGVTLTPLDPTRHAGGSSGGAAAATALGLGTVGIGTDAAGSVRIPAAFCGVVGYKPTFGMIPLDPYPAAFWQLPHIGPITRTVADAVLAALVMSGASGADWTSLVRTGLGERSSNPKIRIGVPAGLDRHLDPAIKNVWDNALSAIAAEMPISIVEIPIEESRDIVGALYRLGCAYAVSQVAEDSRGGLHDDLLQFIEPVKGLTAGQLLKLQRRREEIASRLSALLIDDIDVLLTPTMPCLPIPTSAPAAAAVDWLEWCPFTPLFNLSHGPAISVPWRSAGADLPIGLQVGAAPGRDGLAIAAAAMIEALAGDPQATGLGTPVMSSSQAMRHVLEIGPLATGGDAHVSFLRAGAGDPVLLLHGFASDANGDWVETGWFDALVAAGCDVVAPDLRGHGQSVKSRDPADYRLDTFAGDIATLCNHCWGDLQISLIGYSMGAHIAMSVALASPRRVASLVLGGMGERIAATVGLAPEFADALDMPDEGRAGDRREIPSYAVRFRQHAASRPFNDLQVLAACLRGQSAVFDLDRLTAVTAPTLVIVGVEDRLAGAPYPVAAFLTGGVAQTVPGVNHASALADRIFASECWPMSRAMSR